MVNISFFKLIVRSRRVASGRDGCVDRVGLECRAVDAILTVDTTNDSDRETDKK